jgi:hypothetical protein
VLALENFEKLSDFDFEQVMADLLSSEWDATVEYFPGGGTAELICEFWAHSTARWNCVRVKNWSFSASTARMRITKLWNRI